MGHFIESITTREWALFAWLFLILLGISCWKPKIITGFFCKVFRWENRKLLDLLFFLALYVYLAMLGLKWFGLWEVGKLKATIWWFIGVALPSTYTSKILAGEKRPPSSLDYLKRYLGINIILGLLISRYVFSFYVELLIYWPIIIILTFLNFRLERLKFKGHALTHPHLERLQFLSGPLIALYIFYLGYLIFTDPEPFPLQQTFQELVTPLIFSIVLLPFLNVLFYYICYKNAAFRLNSARKILTLRLRLYAVWYAFSSFRFQHEQLYKWSIFPAHEALTSKEGIRSSIRDFKTALRASSTPSLEPPANGWSPYDARRFLINKGLHMGRYHLLIGMEDSSKEWCAHACLTVRERAISEPVDKIRYKILGKPHVVTRLELHLELYLQSVSHGLLASEERFRTLAVLLLTKVFSSNVADRDWQTFFCNKQASLTLDGKEVIFSSKKRKIKTYSRQKKRKFNRIQNCQLIIQQLESEV